MAGASRSSRVENESRLAVALAVLAAAFPATVLLGWTLDIPLLRGLGNPSIALQPLPSLIVLCIIVALLTLLAGHRVTSRILLVIPCAIVTAVLAQYAGLADIGIGRLFFADQIDRLGVRNGGVPPLGALSLMKLEIAALFVLGSRRPELRRWATPLASSALAATLLLVSFTLTPQLPLGARFFGPSIIAAMPAFLLSAAIIIQGRVYDPIRTFVDSPWHTLQQITPAIIILSILPSLLLVALRDSDAIAENELYYLMAVANLFVVSILLAYVTVRANEQNKRSAARQAELDSILTTVPDAIIVTGHDHRIRTFSAAAEQLWRRAEADACGTPIESLFARRGPDFDALFADAPAIDGAEGSAVAITGCRSDGSEFPAELRVGRARRDGEVVYANFVRDLSQRVSLEDQVAELGLQLAELSHQNVLGELAGDIAHEINQPLAAASNYASAAAMALESENRGKAVELLGQLSAQIQRAGSIIRKLRSLLSHREVELRRETLAEVVNDARNLLLVGSRKLQSSLVVVIPATLPAVYIDRIQIQQVLVNIVRNAFEACDHSGREPLVIIRARPIDDETVEVEVADNGPGLPEGFAERLGERFASSKGLAGLGIGLNISKRIVEAHGGVLEAHNHPAGGAAFRFTILSAAAFDRSDGLAAERASS